MSAPLLVISRPIYYPRHTLEPLPGTPWLRPASLLRRALPLLLSAVALLGVTAAAKQAPALLAVTVIVGIVGVVIIGGGLATINQVQVCPHCLGGMGLGASRCGQCGFRASANPTRRKVDE